MMKNAGLKVSNCTYYYILGRKVRPEGENKEEEKIENNPLQLRRTEQSSRKTQEIKIEINNVLSGYTTNTLSSPQDCRLLFHLLSHLRLLCFFLSVFVSEGSVKGLKR